MRKKYYKNEVNNTEPETLIYLVLGGLVGGIIATIASIYTATRTGKYKDLAEAEEIIELLQGDYEDLLGEVWGALGNVSPSEAGAILKRGRELAEEGYTPTELIELGEMVINAVKSPRDGEGVK